MPKMLKDVILLRTATYIRHIAHNGRKIHKLIQVKVKVPGGLKFLMHYKKSWLSIFQIFRRQDNFFCNKSIMSRLVTEFANISNSLNIHLLYALLMCQVFY